MTRLRNALPYLLPVALALGLLGTAAYTVNGVFRATLDALTARDAVIDSLKARAAQVDTVYVHTRDTLRLVRLRTDSILQRDTLRLTDTLIHVDTVRQIVERERVSCDAVLSACEARVAARDNLIGTLETQLAAERGKDRFFGIRLPSRKASFGLGTAAGIGAALLIGGRR